MQWTDPLSDQTSLIVAVAAIIGLVVTLAKFLRDVPIRVTTRAKLVEQLEAQSVDFRALRTLFGVPTGHDFSDRVSAEKLIPPTESASWERLFIVERLVIVAALLSAIPVGLLTGVAWYELSIVAIVLLPTLILPEHLIYRLFTAGLKDKDLTEPADRRWVHGLLSHHYSLTSAMLGLLYVAALSPAAALSLTGSPGLSLTQLSFVGAVLVGLGMLFGWLFVSQFLDSRERMYDRLYGVLISKFGRPEVRIVLRLGDKSGPPLKCSINSVGENLGVTDVDGYSYEMKWTDISALGIHGPDLPAKSAKAD